MRSTGVLALALALALVVTALPADAKPHEEKRAKKEKTDRDGHDDGRAHVEVSLKPATRAARAAIRAAGSQAAPLLPPSLEPIALFSQSVVMGEDDYAAIAWVAPPAGTTWTGVWWVTSEIGVSPPLTTQFDGDGLWVDLSAGKLAVAPGALNVEFHFLDTAGAHTVFRAPAASVLASPPTDDAIVLGGASVSSAARPDLERVLILSAWNLRDAPARAVVDLPGGPLPEVDLGSCADDTAGPMEPGCRTVFVISVGEATAFTLREELADGTWAQRASHAFADLPYTR